MNYLHLLTDIEQAHTATQAAAARSANHYLTLRNWLIGACIIEYEQMALMLLFKQVVLPSEERLKEWLHEVQEMMEQKEQPEQQ